MSASYPHNPQLGCFKFTEKYWILFFYSIWVMLCPPPFKEKKKHEQFRDCVREMLISFIITLKYRKK